MTTYKRIDAQTVEVSTTNTNQVTLMHCPQCGILCHFSDTPTTNRAIRAGDRICYGCQWANVALPGRKHEGMTWDQFCEKKTVLNQYQAGA